MKALGVDVSAHQRDLIDWQEFRNNGVTFTFLRASIGLQQDEYYRHNHERAGAAGILRGAYHYLYANVGAREQAQLFAQTLLEGELPPVLDVENNGLTESHVRAFLDEFEQLAGRKPIIYTSKYMWHRLLGQNTPWASQYDLWVAHYTTTRPQPYLPDAWQNWTFWQWSETGRLPGYSGSLDMDYFNGDVTALRAYANTLPSPDDTTDGFDFPCGWPSGEGYYIAAGLVDETYHNRWGSWHTGEDWNGLGGGNTDLGDPVYTVADGTVVTSDYFPTSWGSIILIEHLLPSGEKVWTQYAHLQDRMVGQGEKVKRGKQIGTIGRGHEDKYLAHLHFEVRKRDLPPNAWGFTRDEVLSWYAHPTEFIKANRPGGVSVEVLVDEMGEGFTRSDSRYWYQSPIGYGNHAYWTYAMRNREDCVAEWRPALTETGLYEVLAFIPSQNATTKQAAYQITHRRGTDTVGVDQSRYYDQWVSLGRFPLSLSSSMPTIVRLSDKTGEPFTYNRSRRKKIAFDAIRFVLVERE